MSFAVPLSLRVVSSVGANVSIKFDDYYIPCPSCGKTISKINSYWLRQYGLDRLHKSVYTCCVRVCENCYRRSLLGSSRKLFYCQGCGSLKHFDSAVRHTLSGSSVYVCEDCHDRAVDDYFSPSPGEFGFDPVRYDCVCSVCGRAFFKEDTNYKYRAYDDPEPEEPCVCDACSGVMELGEDNFLDFLGIDLDALQRFQTLWNLRRAGSSEGGE